VELIACGGSSIIVASVGVLRLPPSEACSLSPLNHIIASSHSTKTREIISTNDELRVKLFKERPIRAPWAWPRDQESIGARKLSIMYCAEGMLRCVTPRERLRWRGVDRNRLNRHELSA
jgi:hypothetical protein